MSKSTALRALVFLALAASACRQPLPEQRVSPEQGVADELGVAPEQLAPPGQPLPEQGVPPEYGVLYAWLPLSSTLIARTREVSVRVEVEQSGNDEFPLYVLHVETDGGRSARHPWPEGPFNADEIYLHDGSACDQDLIDVVVRNDPPKYADIPSFSYIRFLIDKETLDLMALVPYDPSIEAASGIVPIQSVTFPYGRWPVFSVECDGGDVESVTVRDGYGY